jgi:hypothetical protein
MKYSLPLRRQKADHLVSLPSFIRYREDVVATSVVRQIRGQDNRTQAKAMITIVPVATLSHPVPRLTVTLIAVLVVGCAATADSPRAPGTLTFPIGATQRNAGETGSALMGPQGDKTVIRLTISGVPPWVARPVQLYTFVYAGSCSEHAVRPVYALNEIVQAQLLGNGGRNGPYTLEKTVPASIDALRSAPHALVIRTSPADGNVDIYCGDMNQEDRPRPRVRQ